MYGLITSCAIAAYVWQDGIHGSNDTARYLSNTRQPSPFHRRWLLPAVLGNRPKLWTGVGWLSLIAVGASFQSYSAELLWAAASGTWVLAVMPALVDSFGILAAVVAARLLQTGHPWLGVLAALVAGATKEVGPVFAAIYAWNPLALIGLAAVRWWGAGTPDADPYVGRPLGDTIRVCKPRHDWLNWKEYAIAWKGLLLVAAQNLNPQIALAMLVASAQRIVATDHTRLVLWAVPVIANRPVAWWVILAHCLYHPRKV